MGGNDKRFEALCANIDHAGVFHHAKCAPLSSDQFYLQLVESAKKLDLSIIISWENSCTETSVQKHSRGLPVW